ncbi:DUF4091 domain-containing protein [Niabella sp. CC-SYL272]|uniref:DUF4091 domain-containing protein n=1 Tax=Niabella agricola TaxID=2891571 RepID=UPI001F3BD953|nr:glycoside hydrolase domain-containing protein [Niabella agricola]MCF3111930.1 DUF4091 domain-containing protein [Niabella agricola]
MIRKLLFLAAMGISLNGLGQTSAGLYQVDALEKVFKERAYFPPLTDDTIRAAAGETASIQLVLRANGPLRNLSASAVCLQGTASGLTVKTGWVTYVPVGRSYTPASKDLLRSISGYFPDPIVDDTLLNLSQGAINPLWVSVSIPANIAAGIYRIQVSVSGLANGRKEQFRHTVPVKVYPVKVPETSLWISNWSSHFNPASLELLNKGHKVTLYSPLYWELLKVHADIMAAHNQNVHRIYAAWNTRYTLQHGKYTFDFSNFDKEAGLFEKAGALKRIEGGHLAWRSGAWDDPFFVEVPLEDNEESKKLKQAPNPSISLSGMRSVLLPVSDSRAQNFLNQFLPALKAHLEKKGWLGKYMQHISDEPTAKNAPSYIAISDYVRKYLPGVKIMDAVLTSKELKDGIDVWIPVLDVYHKDYTFYQELKKNGREIWFYTCVGPRGNYANRFIEQPLIQTRYLHWINYKYGATGYLHWGLNYWGGRDPLRDDASRDRGKLPAGDANIVYPGYKKLYTSIRFEAMRDGIYDYELLKMLERKDPAKAKSIVNELILNFNDYDNSIRYFRKIRKQLLEALE